VIERLVTGCRTSLSIRYTRAAPDGQSLPVFERYTESARRTLFFARDEASEVGSRSIETEHLLLGLMRDLKGVIDPILTPVSMDIRKELDRRIVRRERFSTSIEIPFSAETKQALEFSSEEADRLRHGYIGTEHLLLALLRVGRSVAADVLRMCGVDLEETRTRIVTLLRELAVSKPLPPHILAACEQIDRIRDLVVEFGRPESDRQDRRQLIGQICTDLEALKKHLAT
jgi:ATP-dependent Clp protease ATP-binding subunit ClpA